MIIEYFTELQNGFNAFELKQEFKNLAKTYHPDKGGKTSDFQNILKEYQFLSDNIGLNYTHIDSESIENFEDFCASIDPNLLEMYNKLKLIAVPFALEICGDWLWVKVEKTYKDYFNKSKGLGFSWAPKKEAFYWKSYQYKRYHKKTYTMAEIRTAHGSFSPKQKMKLTA